MDVKQQIITYIQAHGPSLPTFIAKHINLDSLFTSAHLSEMVSTNKLKISSLKVGASPLYYLSGQEEKLENFSDKLNEKDRKTYDLLKEKKSA